jgi:ribonuclease D
MRPSGGVPKPWVRICFGYPESPMTHTRHPTPSADQIALLPPFERLGLDRIELITTGAQARHAEATLKGHAAWGFDTESKPTFHKDQVSTGPHVLQLATPERAWVFLLHDPACCAAAAALLAWPGAVKAGFGLGDDRRRIVAKLGVEPARVLELNHVFRERGYRKDMGVKAAVAVVFGQRFAKSKKTATSNWSSPTMTESQRLYAANDAWAAIRVFHALGLDPNAA